MMVIQQFPLHFHVNSVEGKCILSITKVFTDMSTHYRISTKLKRTGRFLPGFSYSVLNDVHLVINENGHRVLFDSNSSSMVSLFSLCHFINSINFDIESYQQYLSKLSPKTFLLLLEEILRTRAVTLSLCLLGR